MAGPDLSALGTPISDDDPADRMLPLIDRLENSDAAAKRTGVPVDQVVSKAGAIGRYQVMPSTGALYGYTPDQLRTPEGNRAAAHDDLAELALRFGQSPALIAAGYNGGPRRAEQIQSGDTSQVPAETMDYYSRALKNLAQGAGAVSDAVVPPAQAQTGPDLSKFGEPVSATSSPAPDLSGFGVPVQQGKAAVPAQPGIVDSTLDYVKHLFAGDEARPQPGKPEDSWLKAMGRSLQNIPAQAERSIGGVLEGAGTNVSVPTAIEATGGANDPQLDAIENGPMAQAVRTSINVPGTPANMGKRLATAAQHDIQENTPNVPGNSAKAYVSSAVGGLAQMAALVAASRATGSAAPMLGGFAVQGYGDQFADSMERGRTPEQADSDAMFSAAANTLPAELPLHALMRDGGTFLGRTLRTMGATALQNSITTALQSAYDKGVLKDGMTWGQAVEATIKSGLVGATVGAILGIGGGAAQRIAAARQNASAARPGGGPPPGAVEPAPMATPAAAPPVDAQAQNSDQVAPAPAQPAAAAAAAPLPLQGLEPVHDPVTWTQIGWRDATGKVLPLDAALPPLPGSGPASPAAPLPDMTAGGAPAPDLVQRVDQAFKARMAAKFPDEARWTAAAPVKTSTLVADAIATGKYNDALHPSNPNARATFQDLTGQALPRSVSATKALFQGQPFPVVGSAAPAQPFRTSAGQIAADHQAEVSRLEAEGTAAAGAKHTPAALGAAPAASEPTLAKEPAPAASPPAGDNHPLFSPPTDDMARFAVLRAGNEGRMTTKNPLPAKANWLVDQGFGTAARNGKITLTDKGRAELDRLSTATAEGTRNGPEPGQAEVTTEQARAALASNIDPRTGKRPQGNKALRQMRADMQDIVSRETLAADQKARMAPVESAPPLNQAEAEGRLRRAATPEELDDAERRGEKIGEDVDEPTQDDLVQMEADRAEEEAAGQDQGDANLAHAVQTHLAMDEKPLDQKGLARLADHAYGGTAGEGAYDPRRAYDAMETGINQHIARSGNFDPSKSIEAAHRDIADLRALESKMPIQSRRTGDTDAFQQFSTPPHYGYAASWLANMRPGDVALEPSAGNGGLATFAKKAGAKVVANEIGEGRRANLERQGFDHVTNHDAEQINNLLPDDVKPNVVVMNPPFSNAAQRGGIKDSNITARHIDQALKKLAPGGRLVAITGHNFSDGNSKNRPFFQRWAKENRIRASVGVDGKVYSRYGTSYPTRVIVIDKAAPDGRPAVTGEAKTPEDLINLLQEVRNDRPESTGSLGAAAAEDRGGLAAREQEANQPGGEAAPGDERGPGRAVPAATGGEGSERPGSTAKPGAAQGAEHPTGDAESGAAPGGDGVAAAGGRGGAEPAERPEGSGDRGRAVPGKPDGGADPGLPAGDGARADLSYKAQDETGPGEELSGGVYSVYKPQRLVVPGARPHPAELVQSAAMASVAPPEPTYRPNLDPKVISEGKLSEAQLEPVVYAGQAHAKMLPDGETRRGFFIGDGTGVGKGREISGIILDNWNQGRKKAVWVSEKWPLLDDAKRDWTGVGGDANALLNGKKFKQADQIDGKHGILFTTYDTLKGKPKKGTTGQTRVEQLVKWLGKDFDGVVAFDEAHNMANADSRSGGRGKTMPAEKALAGLELQKQLPKARVVYVSATGATEVANLGYAERLGLWGPGTSFPTKSQFMAQIEQGGVAAMELVARDLKQMGSYLARGLSFNGVEYSRVEHKLSGQQRSMYDALADSWQMVLRNIDKALEVTGGAKDGRTKSSAYSAFWGSHQRFFNQVLTSMQMPTVLEQAARDIKEGRSPVFQLVNTNEAASERALARMEQDEGALEDLDLTPRDQLMQMVEHSFPVAAMETYLDDNGNERSRPVLDKDGNVVQDRQAVAIRDKVLDDLASVRVPDGPLEYLLNKFGPDVLAEVTGRGRRVVERGGKRVLENRPGSANTAEADAFMSEKKKALVFSQAGGTGRSYHADKGAKNQRQRVHYLLQPGWSAAPAIQGFGRTHRSNQTSKPEYRLATTDVVGQKRFISSIARRLDQLGALTKGERRSGGQGFFSEKDNLESQYAADAVTRLVGDIVARKPAMQEQGLTPDVLTQQMGLRSVVDETTGNLNVSKIPDVTQFLNRLLSLRLDMQDKVFNAFDHYFEDNIASARAAGTLDVGVEQMSADHIKAQREETVHTDPDSGAETKYVALETKTRNRPRQWDSVNSYLKTEGAFVGEGKNGRSYMFVPSRDRTDDRGNVEPQMRRIGPVAESVVPRWAAEQKFDKLEGDEARKAWEKELERVPEFDTRTQHMITGALLPIWDRLPKGYARVMRAKTDDGKSYLGRLIANEQLQATLKNLGATGAKIELPAPEVMRRVRDGDTVVLANGWKLQRRTVAGESRIRLAGPNLFGGERDALTRQGLQFERIGYEGMLFVPDNDKGLAFLEQQMKRTPIVSTGEDEGPAFAHDDETGAPFYSALSRGVEAVKTEKASPEQWLATIRNMPGVKAEERDWSGVEDWLGTQSGLISKDDLLQHLRQNEVQVQEVHKGPQAMGTEAKAKMDALSNELADFALKNKIPLMSAHDMMGVLRNEGAYDNADGAAQMDWLRDFARRETAARDEYDLGHKKPDKAKFGPGSGPGAPLPGGKNYRELLLKLPDPAWMYAGRRDAPSAESGAKVFRSPHFDEANVLAHVRFDDRTGPNGEKVLHIAEIQSDWHQAGRRKGYNTPLETAPVETGDPDNPFNGAPIITRQAGVPDAPFKTSWQELAMKRMLRYAAEHGYDRLSWDTGDTNADRYDLSKQIKTLHVKPLPEGAFSLAADLNDGRLKNLGDFKAAKLPDVIGKDMAKRVTDDFAGGSTQAKSYSGLDLRVGGAGMRGFYDKMLPAFLNRYAKKWGAKVEDSEIGSAYPGNIHRLEGQPVKKTAAVHSIPITDAMRDSVMKGQPMFAQDRGRADKPFSPGTRIEEVGGPRKAQMIFRPEFDRMRGQVEPALRYWLGKYGLSGLVDLKVPDLIRDAAGNSPKGLYFRKLIAVTLSADPGEYKGKLGHEVIHAVRRLGLIDDKEWDVLADKARREGWQAKYVDPKPYDDLDPERKIEEAVAHAFPDWESGKLKPPGNAVTRIFRRIKNLFEAFRNAFNGLGFHSADDVFQKVSSGEIGRRGARPTESDGPDFAHSEKDDGEPEEPEAPDGTPLMGRLDRAIGKVSAATGTKIRDVADRVFPDSVKAAADAVQMAVTPMASGSEAARATAKDFANSMREARVLTGRQIDYLKRTFEPDQLKRMWEAADEQSVAMQEGRSVDGIGLSRLSGDERKAVEAFQMESNSILRVAQDLGMFKGEGLPSYVPRMVVAMGADGRYGRIGRAGAEVSHGLDAIGRNLKTTSPNLKHRKYLTTEETEEAANALAPGAVVVRDFRTLPLAMGRLKEAIAGRTLINNIREMGNSAGDLTVSEGAIPNSTDKGGWFTIDHPAFKTYRPKFVENNESGKFEVMTDQNGDTLFERVPIYVRKDFEGPLRAVLSTDTGAVYRAAMALKGKTMSIIMYSPLMHNAVIWGKAFPSAPLKLLNPLWRDDAGKLHASIELYGRGRALKDDPVAMRQALRDGVDPIGHRYFNQDISAMVEEPNIKPGRSWTAKLLGAVPGMFDPRAGDAVKRAIDRVGDIWHNKLLWNLVGDLQMGLYQHLKDAAVRNGHDEQTAGRYAAHFANRYAGALPLESMSKIARQSANMLLFSRSFTLTNLGAYKDLVAGLPKDIQAQVLRDKGLEALTKIQGAAHRKAASLLMMDIFLSHVGLFLAQYGAAWALHHAYYPPSQNEPDRENRFLIGYQKDGTAIYGRLPTGKVGEELQDWVTEPVDLTKRKLSPFAQAAYGIISNDQGFGRKIYDPYDTTVLGYAKNMGRVMGYIGENVAPISPFQSAFDLAKGHGDTDTNWLKIAAPMVGVTVSKGAPGGPAVGQLYASRDEHEFQIGEQMPKIRDEIVAGDLKDAIKQMTALGMTPDYQRFQIRIAKNPGSRLNLNQIKQFMGYASPDEQEKMRMYLRMPKDNRRAAAPPDQHSALEPGDLGQAVKDGRLEQFAASGQTWSRQDAIKAMTDAGMPAMAAALREANYPVRPELLRRNALGESGAG